MALSPSRLSPLQRDLLDAFFAEEQRLHLTGGAALAGFYLGHRDTDDLDLFGPPTDGLELEDISRTLVAAAACTGGTTTGGRTHPDFRRLLIERGEERCRVDLVIDRAPVLDAKQRFGQVRVDSLREIAANKVCALLGRCEIKDLVDLQAILATGIDLTGAIADAATKDAGVDPATLAWVLDQIALSPDARLPSAIDVAALDGFRRHLVQRLRRAALDMAR